MQEDGKQETKVASPNTWYDLHKDQVRLLQFLLYHLKKHEKQKQSMNQPTKPDSSFSVEFS